MKNQERKEKAKERATPLKEHLLNDRQLLASFRLQCSMGNVAWHLQES